MEVALFQKVAETLKPIFARRRGALIPCWLDNVWPVEFLALEGIMDKNTIIVNDMELALIVLQYRAADFSQRRDSTSDPWERAALDIQLPKIRMAMAVIGFALEAIRVPADLSEHVQGASTARRRGALALRRPVASQSLSCDDEVPA